MSFVTAVLKPFVSQIIPSLSQTLFKQAQQHYHWKTPPGQYGAPLYIQPARASGWSGALHPWMQQLITNVQHACNWFSRKAFIRKRPAGLPDFKIASTLLTAMQAWISQLLTRRLKL